MVTYTELDTLEREARARFGKKVREYRGTMSVTQLALLCNLKYVTIKRIEEGKNCGHNAIIRICKVLEIPYYLG